MYSVSVAGVHNTLRMERDMKPAAATLDAEADRLAREQELLDFEDIMRHVT